MQSHLLQIMTFCFLFLSLPGTAQEETISLQKKTEGFSHPESVVYDEEREIYFVSNMADDEEGDGFISKVGPDGEMLEREWITGLEDPKGLLVQDDKLYVSNNTELVEMNIDKAEISKVIPVTGAESLNDVTVDAAGNIFISDLSKGSIFVMMKDTDEISEWLNSEDLQHPNGLLAHKDQLYVSAWGSDDAPGNFLKVDLDTREITQISKEGIGNLDGVQLTENEEFYISDWGTGKIYKIDKNGNKTEVLTAEKSSGDILYLPSKDQLVLPMNFQNSVWWYRVE